MLVEATGINFGTIVSKSAFAGIFRRPIGRKKTPWDCRRKMYGIAYEEDG
jgi:hypothetical protein